MPYAFCRNSSLSPQPGHAKEHRISTESANLIESRETIPASSDHDAARKTLRRVFDETKSAGSFLKPEQWKRLSPQATVALYSS